jgi:hypothetical protein
MERDGFAPGAAGLLAFEGDIDADPVFVDLGGEDMGGEGAAVVVVHLFRPGGS